MEGPVVTVFPLGVRHQQIHLLTSAASVLWNHRHHNRTFNPSAVLAATITNLSPPFPKYLFLNRNLHDQVKFSPPLQLDRERQVVNAICRFPIDEPF
jgi:hypothetical protein